MTTWGEVNELRVHGNKLGWAAAEFGFTACCSHGKAPRVCCKGFHTVDPALRPVTNFRLLEPAVVGDRQRRAKVLQVKQRTPRL
jgi:hypothetical protein